MNEENELRTIDVGVISEKEFVELFATQKQKDKYYANGCKFSGNNKQTVLKQARRECGVEDLKNRQRQYDIKEVYKYPVPKNFDKMNNGLYKYLIPLILIKLILTKIYEGDNITFSCTRWFEMVDLINRNYINMKQNIEYTSKKIFIDEDVLNEYFGNTNDVLLYLFKKSLEHLKTAQLFNYQEINWVCVREVEESTNEDKKQTVDLKRIHRRATADEMEFIRACDQAACMMVDIAVDDYKAKYYGAKSHSYLENYKELLSQKNIVFVYKAYEIYSTDRDIQKCYELLNNFDISDRDGLADKLVSAFQKNIIVNVGKRISEKPQKYGVFNKKQSKDFINDYNKIATLTLGSADKNKLIKDIPKVIDEADATFINEFIEERFNFNIDGMRLDVGVV